MTIKDIARLSGFGPSTVSRALSNHPDVSKDTYEKIKAVADKYNFIPNSIARELKQQTSKTVLVIVKGTYNHFLASLLEKIQSLIVTTGYEIMVNYINQYDNEVSIANRICLERKPLGVIFLGGNIEYFNENFAKIKAPSVLCTTSGKGLAYEHFSSVSIDDSQAAKDVINLLIKKGHRHIGLIGGNEGLSFSSNLRYLGCKNAYLENCLPLENLHYCCADYAIDKAYLQTKDLVVKNENITAIFAMSDLMALGAMRAINDMNLKIPDDISVVGFDGIELTQYVSPRLTTVLQPVEQISKKSVQLLLDMIERNSPSQHVLMNTEIILEKSVRSI